MQNPLSSLKVQDEKYLGIYRGVIEDNNDPEKMGRCKVRVFSVHGRQKTEDNKSGIKTEDLPWAFPGLSLIEGGIGGFGFWTIPHNGSHVYVFFEGGNKTQPRYFASAPGLLIDSQYTALKDNQNEGFKDPNLETPGNDPIFGSSGVENRNYPYEHRVGEADWHKLSRDSNEETLVDHKNEQLVEEIILAKSQGKWNEPAPYYLNSDEPKYPDNHVLATSNGIVLELDASNHPRIHMFHPSNSYLEIDETGNMVFKINEDRFDITLQNHNEYIKLNSNITIDKDKTEMVGVNEYLEVMGERWIEIHKTEEKLIHESKTLYVGMDEIETVENDRYTDILNNYYLDIGVDRDAVIRHDDFLTVFNDRVIEIRNNDYMYIEGYKTVEIQGSRDVTIGGSETVYIGGNCDITVGGNCNITVSGTCNIQAATILLNS